MLNRGQKRLGAIWIQAPKSVFRREHQSATCPNSHSPNVNTRLYCGVLAGSRIIPMNRRTSDIHPNKGLGRWIPNGSLANFSTRLDNKFGVHAPHPWERPVVYILDTCEPRALAPESHAYTSGA